jgi:hypothetical protein
VVNHIVAELGEFLGHSQRLDGHYLPLSCSISRLQRYTPRKCLPTTSLSSVLCVPKVEGQTAPKAILSGPYGKSRLPAMPEELPSFSWEEVFKYAVAELDLPSREERRERIEEFLERFQEMVGESK